jgi:hypothetical protein
MRMNIIEACEHPEIWRPWFRNVDDWRAWFVVLKVLFGIMLDDGELQLWKQHTGRTEPLPGGYKEAWLCVGRRGGKSLIMATVACFLAIFCDWSKHSVAGESLLVQVLASDRRQARIVLRYAKALLSPPLLKELVAKESEETIELKNGISLEITTNSYRSVRGYTLCAALLDEVAFWRSDSETNPDSETLIALRPAMATIPGAMLIGASSPYSRKGVLYENFRDHWAEDKSRVLVWRATTREMHPGFPQELVDQALERDAAAAGAEYLAEFRSDIEAYLTREIVDACTIRGRHELLPERRVGYKVFIDPSGGSSDSMTLAIAHAEKGVGVLDLLHEYKPPFSPEIVVREFTETIRRYGIGSCQGDRYGGQWIAERFSEHGISYEPSERTTSDTYRECLPLFMAGKVELLDNSKLAIQLSNLERRVTRGSREYVSHPVGSHDDLATAACGALVAAAGQRDRVEIFKMLGVGSKGQPVAPWIKFGVV